MKQIKKTWCMRHDKIESRFPLLPFDFTLTGEPHLVLHRIPQWILGNFEKLLPNAAPLQWFAATLKIIFSLSLRAVGVRYLPRNLTFKRIQFIATPAFLSTRSLVTTNSAIAMSPVRDTAADTLTSTSAPSSIGVLLSYLYKPLGLVVALASIGVGLLYHHQDKLLYFPTVQGLPKRTKDNPKGYRSPAEHHYEFEDHFIQSPDGVKFHSWLIFPKHHTIKKSDRPTVIFFHGNAGNIGLRLPNAMQMCDILSVNVLLVEYRGYGNSPGNSVKPSEAGIKRDSESVLHYCLSELKDKIDVTKLFVFGRSLGGAVGFHLALYAEQQQMPLKGLMVENTFLSISDMVDQVLPFLTPIKAFVLKLDWNSAKLAPQLKQTSIFYIAGLQDELVPHSHMTTLHSLSQKQQAQHSNIVVHWHAVPTGTHNDTFMRGGKAYWDAMRLFMQQALKNNFQINSVNVPQTPVDEAIPIMPGNLFGIAKEALSNGNGNEENGSSKKKD